MPHGFEDCKTCTKRHDLCKKTKIKNCRATSIDIFRQYEEEKSLTQMFAEKVTSQ